MTEIRAFELAKTAPRLYWEGELEVVEPNAKEWVTWKAGFIDKAFVRSARAPSNIKLVRWVAEFKSYC